MALSDGKKIFAQSPVELKVPCMLSPKFLLDG